jgi:SAM-dependent methyltransferase
VTKTKDCWADWLAERRYGGDPEVRRRFTETLLEKRDRVLERGGVVEGVTVLDVGCGEGLVGFGALERGAADVVFSDISQDVLDVCAQLADELGVRDRCRFARAAAEDLAAIDTATVDVVTTRAVLIYVADKLSAFREFARVLRPGGRISLLEPINRFARTDADTWAGYDLAPVSHLYRKLRSVYEAIQPPDTDPMLDFDERDLVRLAEDTGFFPIHLRLEGEIVPLEPRRWDGFLAQAGNPRIPTIAEAMEQALTPEERDELTAHLRPLVEEGRGVWRMAEAQVFAVKSASAGLH